jgi:hypothetical protein
MVAQYFTPRPCEPFTFDPVLHLCRDARGLWIPSNTQILEAQGLSTDWDEVAKRIGQDRLDRKSALGTEVHDLTDIYDEFGEVDPAWLNRENEGYFQSWIGFRERYQFTPKYWSHRRIATVNGMRFTMELDDIGMLGKHPAIIDKKCSEFDCPSWGYQVAGYEIGWFESPRCGRVLHGIAQLKEDGSPGRLIEYPDYDDDAQQFMCALTNVTARIKHGLLRPPEE